VVILRFDCSDQRNYLKELFLKIASCENSRRITIDCHEKNRRLVEQTKPTVMHIESKGHCQAAKEF
jgi:hypothetical protein